ncbi:hypothetical protein [Kitasatospora sp. NPDC085464]|uniref:hypothetical protein n=1 Tax=Kitasatospora sp. NPDC085464 TaxID=3364063 RepID=UPI0037C56ABE
MTTIQQPPTVSWHAQWECGACGAGGDEPAEDGTALVAHQKRPSLRRRLPRPASEYEVAVLVLSHPLIDPAATNGASPVLRMGEGVMCPCCRGDLQAELVVVVLGVQRRELDEVAEVLTPDVGRGVENDLELRAGRNNLDPADAVSMGITGGAKELFD